MSYSPKHAAAGKTINHELRRKIKLHVIFMIAGILISVIAVVLHMDIIPALAAPVAAPIAQEGFDFIANL